MSRNTVEIIKKGRKAKAKPQPQTVVDPTPLAEPVLVLDNRVEVLLESIRAHRAVSQRIGPRQHDAVLYRVLG